MTSKPVLTIALLMITAGSGCTMFTKDKGSKKDSPWESMKFWKKEYQTPAKMAVLWSPDLLTVAGQPPTRGFGGRIYFYNQKSQTIPVDGELVVHGFDEARKKNSGGEEHVPDKRFRFTAEQFTEHFSESEIGASYSVWIPWDTNDYTQKELTLIPTFISKNGQMVQGAPAKVIIPGRTAAQPNQVTPVQTVAFEQSTVPTVEGKLPTLNMPVRNVDPLRTAESSDMRVTTINVPTTAQRHGRGHTDTQAAANANAIANAHSPVNQLPVGNANPLQSGMAQHVNAQLDQMRAQAIADAFRPLDQQIPASMYQNVPQQTAPPDSSWAPNSLPSASMRAVNLKNITPPNFAPNNAYAPTAAPQSSTGAVNSTGPVKSLPQNYNSSTPYRGDDYPGGLPPGIQLSPAATAW